MERRIVRGAEKLNSVGQSQQRVPASETRATMASSGNSTATLVNHLEYNAFGTITSQTNSAYRPPQTNTGQIQDPATRLLYYDARWYDPGVAQFVSEDPIGFAAGDSNLSRYVGNSMPNAVDPTGLEEWRPVVENGGAEVAIYSQEEGIVVRVIDGVPLILRWSEFAAHVEDKVRGDAAWDEVFLAEGTSELPVREEELPPPLPIHDPEYSDILPDTDLTPGKIKTICLDASQEKVMPIAEGVVHAGNILVLIQPGPKMRAPGGTTIGRSASTSGRGGQAPHRIADPAEEAVSTQIGIPRNTKPKQGISSGTGTAPNGRKPDVKPKGQEGSINQRGSVVEVKAGAHVRWSGRDYKQMRDYIAFVEKLRNISTKIKNPTLRKRLAEAHVEVWTNSELPLEFKIARERGRVKVYPLP